MENKVGFKECLLGILKGFVIFGIFPTLFSYSQSNSKEEFWDHYKETKSKFIPWMIGGIFVFLVLYFDMKFVNNIGDNMAINLLLKPIFLFAILLFLPTFIYFPILYFPELNFKNQLKFVALFIFSKSKYVLEALLLYSIITIISFLLGIYSFIIAIIYMFIRAKKLRTNAVSLFDEKVFIVD